jgi:hypothetical protein
MWLSNQPRLWLADRPRRWLAALALTLAAIAARGENLAVTAAFDPEGSLWRLQVDGGRLQLDRSEDLGASFGAPVAVSAPGQPLAIGVEERPAIAFAGGQVQVGYPVAAGAHGSRLFLARSADGGASFAPPQPLSEVPGRLHRLALDAAGRPYHLWYRDAGTRGAADLYLAAAGQPPRRLAGDLCDCCRPAFALTADDRPVIAARYVFPGDIRDHVLLQPSAPGTLTPRRVTFDDWQVHVCPTQGPALAIGADGRYHLAWFTLGANRGLFYAHSDDGGKAFSTAMPFGDPNAHAMNPRVAVSGTTVTLAWQEFRDGRIRILARRSGDGGDTWAKARELASTAGAADRAELITGPAGSFVSWNTRAEGYLLIAAAGG